jgi:4-hydroxy-tetrahydrodipicolinate reductase
VGAHVLVDFSTTASAPVHAEAALRRGVAPIIGATGLGKDALRDIARLCAEHNTPAMYVPNFAIGAVLMMKFAEMAAQWLPDVEIIELHHDKKEDAPSGTSMRTAELISAARKAKPGHRARPSFKVEGVRGGLYQDVTIHSIRLKGLLAHQEVIFGGSGEVLTLRHDSLDRSSFMEGVKLCAREVWKLQGLTVGMDSILFGA